MYTVFLKYLYENPSFKSGKRISASAKKYADAINSISNDMEEAGLINLNLHDIHDVQELDNTIKLILENDFFLKKNHRGNKMYSNALEHYQYFMHKQITETPVDTSFA